MTQSSAPANSSSAQAPAAEVRRYLPIQMSEASVATQSHAMTSKGGNTNGAAVTSRYDEALTGETDMAGSRKLYLLAHADADPPETPVFAAGPDHPEDAVAVFSTREMAVLYLQVARWDDQHVYELAPLRFSRWVQNAKQQGLRYLMIDPNRHDQALGRAQQPLLDLHRVHDLSGENLYQEVRATAQS